MNTAAHAIRRRRRRHNAGERPFIVIRESTRACPPACLHCRAEAVPDRDPRELDTAAAKELLRRGAVVRIRPGSFPHQQELTAMLSASAGAGGRTASYEDSAASSTRHQGVA